MNAAGSSPWSTPSASVTVTNLPPDVPTLTATASATGPTVSVGLSWTASARATSYALQRSTDPTFPVGSTSTVTTTGTTSTDTSVLAKTTYYYRVSATNAANQPSAWSATATVTTADVQIPAPANLTATANPGAASIDLAWAPSMGATSYVVQRSTDGFATFVQTLVSGPAGQPTPTAWSDTGVTPGTTSTYRVAAYTVQGGPSPWSNTASATILLAPTAVTATASTAWPLTVKVGWNASTAATGYVVQRASNAGFTTGVVTFPATTAAPYVDTTALPVTQYWYRVQATGPGGPSPWSAAATVTTPTVSLVTPTGLAAAVTAAPPAGVSLTWATQPWAAAYTVIRATNAAFTTGWTTFTTPTASFTDTTVVVGTRYYYRVQATYPTANGVPAGASNLSASVNLTVRAPAAPGNLRLTATRVTVPVSANVTVSWSQSTTTATVGGFVLQRSTSATFATVDATIPLAASARSYVDTGLARNTRYYYRIQAVNGAGSSGWTTGNLRTPV